MKILLDECIDRRFTRELKGFYVRTVPQQGWRTIKNGKLLGLAEKHFDVFITVDRNLSTQQHLAKFNIAVIVIRSASNRFDDLKPLTSKIISALPRVKKRQVIFVSN